VLAPGIAVHRPVGDTGLIEDRLTVNLPYLHFSPPLSIKAPDLDALVRARRLPLPFSSTPGFAARVTRRLDAINPRAF
jgi:hypothetical protein